MRFYLWNFSIAKTDLDFEPYRRPELELPRAYCPECGCDFFSAPEASDIPEPIPREALKLLRLFDREVPDDLHRRYWTAFGRGDFSDPVIKEYQRFNALPITDFRQLAETLRQIYGLPSNRPIEPAAHLGLPFVKRSYTPQWLAYGPDSMTGSLYFSQRAVELFVEAGIKGIEFFPVHTSRRRPSSVFLGVVTGNGGPPRVEGGS